MHIFITGASSGIGAAIARSYAATRADEPVRITIAARRVAELEALAKELVAAGAEAFALPLDVADLDAVGEAHDAAVAKFGPVDVLVANAGLGEPTTARRLRPDRIQQILRVNVEGATNLICAVLPSMIERKQGHIAAVSSLAGRLALPGHGAYCASKAALSTFLECLRPEVEGLGIQITAIHPGFVATPMTAKNRFPMPWLWTAEQAGAHIVARMRRRPRSIDFPKPLVWLVAFASMLPRSWVARVVSGRAG